MSEPFVGEIRMFGGNFAPRAWAFCDGQLMAVSQNDALFSLLGTIYGGDGRTTFGLPDMRGRIPIHQGSGPGLTPRRLGSQGGTETVTLTTSELPSHSHSFKASSASAESVQMNNNVMAQAPFPFYSTSNPSIGLNGATISNTGGTRAHDNMMPALCINFIIALYGIYPSRS